MKIAYFQNEFPVLTQTFVSNEVTALIDRGHEVVVVASRKGNTPPLVGATPIVLAGTPTLLIFRSHVAMLVRTPRAYFLYARELISLGMAALPWGLHVPRLLADERLQALDHVHTHFSTRAAVTARLFASVQHVGRGVTTHAADIFKPNPNLAKQLSGALVATSTTHNLEVMRGLGYPDALLIPNGVPSRSSHRKRRTNNTFRVVSVGRLVQKKGHADLVQAIKLLKLRGIDVSCIIIGSGPDHTELSALIADLGLTSSVTLAGSKSHEETFSYYADADVFALASKIDSTGDVDGLPVALLDAASTGIPIVATQVSGLAEFIDDDVAWSASPNDPTSLAEALGQVAADPGEAERRAARAIAKVNADYGIEKQMGRFLELAEASRG